MENENEDKATPHVYLRSRGMKNLMRPWTCTPLTIQYDLYIMCDNICANCLHLFFHCRCMRAKCISKVHLIGKKFAVASYCEWWRLHRQPALIERLPRCEVTLFFSYRGVSHIKVFCVILCDCVCCAASIQCRPGVMDVRQAGGWLLLCPHPPQGRDEVEGLTSLITGWWMCVGWWRFLMREG